MHKQNLTLMAERAERNEHIFGKCHLMDLGVSSLIQMRFAKALRDAGKVEAKARKKGFINTASMTSPDSKVDSQEAEEYLKERNQGFVERHSPKKTDN